MRGNAGRPDEHSLFSRQRTSSVERELASTPYAFSPKPIVGDDHIRSIQRAKESLLNPFEDDINVRLAKQRLFSDPSRAPTPSLYPSTTDFNILNNNVQFIDDAIYDALSSYSENSLRNVGELSRLNSEDTHSLPTVPDVQTAIKGVVTHLPTYERSRILAEAYEEGYKDRAHDRRRLEDVFQDSVDRSQESYESDVVTTNAFPAEGREAFTVLRPAVKNEDVESSSSVPSSYRVKPTAKSHRVKSFAIVGEALAPGTSVGVPGSEVGSSAGNDAPSISSSIGRGSTTGRVSPFRGKGFKADPFSRHTSPRTSTTSSPQRSRSNSLTRPTVTFSRPPTPPRNYIRENIREVQELSKFVKERNDDLAERKKFEEELEILRELGVISQTSVIKLRDKMDRSMSVSPSAILHYENIKVLKKNDVFDQLSWMPPAGKSSLKATSKSQPQSKTGSPQHHSKIPRRQTSVSPPRYSERMEYLSSVMSNQIPPNGRFISNSTSSINDRRIFSVITDDDNNPVNPDFYRTRSISSQNLTTPSSILKSKPPISPSRLGPPPTSKNSKRLSPIVSTPDKSTAQSTPARKGMKSKTPTPRVTSPTKIPRRPSKSQAASPSNSRGPSRAGSKPDLADSGNTQKETARGGNKPSMKRITSRANMMSRMSNDSKTDLYNNTSKQTADAKSSRDGNVKPSLKRVTSKMSLISRMSGGSGANNDKADSKTSDGKPSLKRVTSRVSLISKMSGGSGGTSDRPESRNSNEKPTLKRVSSRISMVSKMSGGKPDIKGSSMRSGRDEFEKGTRKSREVTKRDVSTTRSNAGIDDVPKQDNETQYDKTSESGADKLIPLTKTNVVSMTTAAITSQPLEIAAKVTSQLPSAFEKAREKGIFEKNSSSDSLVAKMPLDPTKTESAEKPKSDENTIKVEDKTALQKTASKSSLAGAKEEKEVVTKGGTIIQNNLKLIPVDNNKTLDPQIEKVRMKIDNILKSNASSVVDLKDRADGESLKTLDKVADKIEDEVKTTVTTAVIEKADVQSIQSSLSSAKTEPKEDGKKAAPETILKKIGSMKAMTPIEKIPSKKDLLKPEEPKNAAELVVVKESVIKKEILSPAVEVVNERTLGTIDDGIESVTEIIRGDPDVEVQSGNVSPAMMNMSRNKPTTSVSNGASNGASNISNGTTTKLSQNEPQDNNNESTTIKSNKISSVTGNIKDNIDVEKAAEKKSENICKRIMGGCAKNMPCCGQKQNLSKVHLINEKDNKKNSSKMEANKNKGALSKLNCCKKKESVENEMMNITSSKVALTEKNPNEAEASSRGCLSCCGRKNKIRDSSANRTNMKAKRWYDKINCCKKEKSKEPDWAARRDSILSQPPSSKNKGCCGGRFDSLLCCKKKSRYGDESRRTSNFSKKRSLSQAVPMEEAKKKIDPSLVEHASHMRGAIPALPIPLAWTCLMCNVIFPGLGTLLSGIFCLCFGKPRFSINDGYRQRIGAFVIDVFVALGQLFTVLFCLVGWGWSIWWGTIMVKVARKYKKLRLAAEDPERAAPTTNNQKNGKT